jgi:16S rRNA (uracil1498-N3)-methyltransferase
VNAFIVLPQNIFPDRLMLVAEEAHHCSRVLRMHAGEELMAIDGVGCAYRATIVTAEKNKVECTIDERLPNLNEPLREVALAVSLLKHSAKFDIVVEKAVELGVSAILPLISARCERQTGNTERWRSIAESATKQSLRCRIPGIEDPAPFAAVCATKKYDSIVIAHEKAPVDAAFSKFLAGQSAAHRSPEQQEFH